MTTINASDRVTNLMQSQTLLSDLQQTQAQMQKVETQISTGNIVNQASDNPLIAGQLMSLNSMLDRIGQYKSNADTAGNVLTAASTALTSAAGLVQQASALASSAANATTTDSQRASDASELGAIISQMQQLANTQYNGQYLFAGQGGQGSAPFASAGGGILYTGSSQPTSWQIDNGWTMQSALDGGSAFGGESAPVDSGLHVSLAADATTPLSDLGGATGSGVALGTISVSDGVNPATQIDVSHASTLGDLIAQFNAAAPAGTTMSLAAGGRQVTVATTQAGGELTISDVAGGATASGLGITAAGSSATVTGQDLGPRLSATTELADLAGLDTSGSIQITNGSQSATISLSGMTQVQDLANAVNSAGLNVRLSIAPDGQSLQMTNLLSGSSLSVSDVGGGTAAAQLGLRTFSASTPLAWLNGGQGITAAGNNQPDFSVTLHDGSTVQISLTGCNTVGDVVAAINGASTNTGELVAGIDSAGGISLADSSTGSSDFSVTALNQSAAASELGLVQDTAGTTIVGTDTAAVGTGGIFQHLLALQQALTNNDLTGITTQGGLLQTDATNLATVQGETGAQAAAASAQSTTLASQTTAAQTLISQTNGVDLTAAISQFEQLQLQLNASMSAMGQMLGHSLFNYLAAGTS